MTRQSRRKQPARLAAERFDVERDPHAQAHFVRTAVFDMPTLTDPPSPDNLKIRAFEALCWSRAERWRAGEWDWIGRAVDPLQFWAEAEGLVEAIGQDAVQAMMAEAFHG